MEINGVEKLLPNLRDKKSYVIHIQALNQALQHGLRLDRIHRAIEFDQSPWLKTYVDFNTQLRTAATNDFEKYFFKLMNNSVFGKTMENIRKHRNIKLVMTEEKYLHTVMKPNFKSGVLFGENLMGCEMGKIKVVMNKPVYLGQAILDLSKIIMYEFPYDYMVPKYDLEKLKLCCMDTDSLVYDIKTEDFYEDIANDVEARFDTSGYSKTDFRLLPIGLNKKVIGLMKDELGGKIMTEFVALRPKLYSYKKLDGSEDKKCKGIKKCVVKKTLTFEDYKACLFNDSTEYRSQLMFRSAKHEVHTSRSIRLLLTEMMISGFLRKTGYQCSLEVTKIYVGVLYLVCYCLSRMFFMLVKMPHSNFKERSQEFNTGVGKCPCGQTFEYTSERDMKMKLRMHRRFCSNPPKGFDKIGIPKKAMTLREQQLNEAERIRKVHN